MQFISIIPARAGIKGIIYYLDIEICKKLIKN